MASLLLSRTLTASLDWSAKALWAASGEFLLSSRHNDPVHGTAMGCLAAGEARGAVCLLVMLSERSCSASLQLVHIENTFSVVGFVVPESGHLS